MAFRWLPFLQQHRIPYVERGPNINRDQVGIRCPFCGEGDQSQHLALNLASALWVCRRNIREHSGRSPIRLVAKLLNISTAQAAAIVGEEGVLREPDADFGNQIRTIFATAAKPAGVPKPQRFPKEFKPLTNKSMGRLFYDYLIGRGYTVDQLNELIERFDLRYAITGRYSYRVIVPIFTKAGLMSWTGRSISKASEIRYLSFSEKDFPEDEAPLLTPIKQLLLNEQDLDTGGDVLVCCEGPFDGARVDLLGYPLGVRGTCVFGKTLSDIQVQKLLAVSPRYRARILLLDRDAMLDAFPALLQLERGGWRAHYMQGGKDPAAMPEPELLSLLKSFRDKITLR